eukprot:gnl/Chilomastix_cuspidata/3943.p1 GENE.gnl/Chilomastix_cuspidata/3943~~gnl/Chilomastix_cuspidata/3943.p1  ORF type:complete len:400 (-),score=67.34 gnl/Chilomastix_cuspidata/3943:965-2164(-)
MQAAPFWEHALAPTRTTAVPNVCCVAISGQFLLVGQENGKVSWLSIDNLSCKRSIYIESSAISILEVASLDTVWVGLESGALRILRITKETSGDHTVTIERPGRLRAKPAGVSALLAAGGNVWAGAPDASLRVFARASGAEHAAVVAHRDAIVALLGARARVWAVSRDGLLTGWGARTLASECIARLPPGHAVCCAACVGDMLWVGVECGDIFVVARGGAVLGRHGTPEAGGAAPVSCIAFDAAARRFAFAKAACVFVGAIDAASQMPRVEEVLRAPAPVRHLCMATVAPAQLAVVAVAANVAYVWELDTSTFRAANRCMELDFESRVMRDALGAYVVSPMLPASGIPQYGTTGGSFTETPHSASNVWSGLSGSFGARWSSPTLDIHTRFPSHATSAWK